MIVLGEGDDVTLGSDLEPAAARDFDLRTMKVRNELARPVEDGHVELKRTKKCKTNM